MQVAKDETAHGEYRTRRVILEIYDAMQQAIETGQFYQTLLDPPPTLSPMPTATPEANTGGYVRAGALFHCSNRPWGNPLPSGQTAQSSVQLIHHASP